MCIVQEGKDYLQKIHRCWRASEAIKKYSPADQVRAHIQTVFLLSYVMYCLQYEIRVKGWGYDLVGREKRDWGYQGRWMFDELSKPDRNPNHAKYETVVSSIVEHIAMR